jgi:hypothetical protein
MRPEDTSSELLERLLGCLELDEREQEPPATWVFRVLSYGRELAQLEATLAYEEWQRRPGAEAYAAFRAAQDQADAAQDALARSALARHGT